ncbi:SprT family zinc-dependent metalloprotease [Comamonas faecalis]|uniref:SprT family zinc-dependent metalloprotease n=1 Tax=Comamonas faecalis TaxID=1387849 RepID=A0ABP7RE87_9BURK
MNGAVAAFLHPRANRELQLGDTRVAYVFERARRRSIGLSVGPEGLAVRAPAWATQAQVAQVLNDKAGWIVRKLAEQRERAQQQQVGRIAWQDGAQLPYLGALLTLRLDAGLHPGTARLVDDEAAPTLLLRLPPQAEPAQLRAAVHAWWRRQALAHYGERIAHYAPQLGVHCQRLLLTQARTRWGSASADGTIRLNTRLLHYPQAIIDYVVVHELAHLRHMDHSPRFWAVVASVLPDHQQLRRQLRAQPAPLWGDV